MKENKLKVSEESFQRTVIDLAHTYGYKVAHFRKARKSNGDWITPVGADGKGWLDLILANKDKRDFIVAELKSEDGKMTKEQKMWFGTLKQCCHSVYVWRPSDYEDIVLRLKR
ncbi:MAG: hypothetical protein WC516_07855 [Patescibacteria group bacterium]